MRLGDVTRYWFPGSVDLFLLDRLNGCHDLARKHFDNWGSATYTLATCAILSHIQLYSQTFDRATYSSMPSSSDVRERSIKEEVSIGEAQKITVVITGTTGCHVGQHSERRSDSFTASFDPA